MILSVVQNILNKLVSKFPVVKVYEYVSKHKYGEMVLEKFNGTFKGIEIYASCMKGIEKDNTVRNPAYIESIIEKRLQGITCFWGTCKIVVVEETHHCVEHLPMELAHRDSQAENVCQLSLLFKPLSTLL